MTIWHRPGDNGCVTTCVMTIVLRKLHDNQCVRTCLLQPPCDDRFATTTVLRKLHENQCVRTTLLQPPCDDHFVTTTLLHLCHNRSVTTTVRTGMWQTVLQLCDNHCATVKTCMWQQALSITVWPQYVTRLQWLLYCELQKYDLVD